MSINLKMREEQEECEMECEMDRRKNRLNKPRERQAQFYHGFKAINEMYYFMLRRTAIAPAEPLSLTC